MYQLTFAVPNGGYRSPKTAATLKREGVKAGIPDIFMAVPVAPYAGLFIELKIKPNRCSPKQLVMHELLSDSGYKVVVCWSWDEMAQTTKDYLDGKLG